jgi:hypothetical protein
MADISADSLIPSGDFKATLFSTTQSIASGSSGTLVTLTATGGRKIRLTMLFTELGAEPGITITADGVAVVSNKQLNQSTNSVDNFAVGSLQGGTTCFSGNIRYIEANNSIVISKVSGSTGRVLLYATEQGF